MLGCFILVIIPQSGQPTPSFQSRPIATSVDSVLYYLQRFSPAFATTDKTSGYLQVQYLFAYSIRECPLAIRTADHKWTMLTSLTSWCTETATWEYIGIEPTPPA